MNQKKAKALRRALREHFTPERTFTETPLLRPLLVPGQGELTYCKGHQRECDDERRTYRHLKSGR